MYINAPFKPKMFTVSDVNFIDYEIYSSEMSGILVYEVDRRTGHILRTNRIQYMAWDCERDLNIHLRHLKEYCDGLLV